MAPYTRFQDTALALLRLTVAAVFLYAAFAKLGFWSSVPEGMSLGMANLVRFLSVVEPLGALALVIGFLTRWAALGLAVIMAGAILFLQFGSGVGFATTPQGTGWDYNLLVLAGSFVLAAFGAGSFSIDERKGR